MALKANYPALVFPAKFAITYPLVRALARA